MNDLRSRLRDADPVRLEPAVPGESLDEMRRAIVHAAEAAAPGRLPWRQSFAFAAMTAVAVIGATAAYRYAEEHDAHELVVHEAAAAAQATQVQFRTPGGTRIIWTLDPTFNLGGPRP